MQQTRKTRPSTSKQTHETHTRTHTKHKQNNAWKQHPKADQAQAKLRMEPTRKTKHMQNNARNQHAKPDQAQAKQRMEATRKTMHMYTSRSLRRKMKKAKMGSAHRVPLKITQSCSDWNHPVFPCVLIRQLKACTQASHPI